MNHDRLSLWEAYQQDLRQDDKIQTAKRVIIKLPCCGASIEYSGRGDQYVVCPDKDCRKKNVILPGLNPKIRTEAQEHGRLTYR